MPYTYDLTLGLPHTNHRFFCEHLMLKHAGHFQWQALAAAAGLPLSSLRTAGGGEVYAGFYYIEIVIPDAAPLESFRLDDIVRFEIALRAFKNIAFEGRVRFDRPERLDQTESPFILFANIFMTPVQGNSVLRVAPPVQADFQALPPLPNEENPYQLTRAASESGSLGVLDQSWSELTSYTHRYAIDVDRDTNGAGLVYFANYVAFMDTAERLATPGERERSLRHRRIAYYGNADVDDTLTIVVTVFRSDTHRDRLGFRWVIRRQEDDRVICLSEAIKALA
jgi:probable biosynthetic protein (TIGR04098 family)